jgi:hypothetical protein
MLDEGRRTFRYDTFGDETFWGDALQLHKAIEGEKHGGVGAGVSPKTALAVGLKVDVDALPVALRSQPKPPAGSFAAEAASRGKALFAGKARCASCHVPPLYTEPGHNLHAPSEIGVDSFQADRSPTHAYRTAPLRGLWTHQKGGFYHDGRFATLKDVVDHYDSFFNLGLTDHEKSDLIQYLLSL